MIDANKIIDYIIIIKRIAHPFYNNRTKNDNLPFSFGNHVSKKSKFQS